MKVNQFGLSFAPCLAVILVSVAQSAQAYPEYQAFSEKHSGRTTDCSMCHTNSNGPIGQSAGQLGGLTAADMERLNTEHAAMEPGVEVDSPVLNRFGNLIIKKLGRKKVIDLRQQPAQLATALGEKSDLDGDGISDAREYLDGTDPLNKSHGDPLKLLVINAGRFRAQILLAVVSVSLLTYGFMELLRGFAETGKAREPKIQQIDQSPSDLGTGA